MKNLICVFAAMLIYSFCFSQSNKVKPTKYPSLLWEISGKGLTKPSHLFGTMHVSSKMVFNLSDSFYLAIKNAQVVALETNPGTWQEDFSRYDMEGEGRRLNGRYNYSFRGYSAPQDYLSINTLKLTSYEKMMEAALYSSPSIINSFLYRSNSERSSDFEEDTYLDLHIFQTGKKLGKRLCGVENFDGSMQLVKEAYADAAKEKGKKERSYDYEEDFSYRRLEEAYRTGNLDLLDTINKVNSQSAAFDEKFLYRRNEIQAHSIDSILKTGTILFVGVGAAHLPGERGVIEALRRAGYKLRPIKMTERDSRHKEEIENIRVPVQFSKQTADDGFFSVNVPGKLYSFTHPASSVTIHQFTDMINGSYYMVTRMFTNAAILGNSEAQVQRKLDSVLYENIPGKLVSKKPVVKNGYHGFEVLNRTRRGDYQRYSIFVTPFEIILFKMSGNGEYVKLGTEASQFFNSIQLKEYRGEAKKYSPASGGFEVELPHLPQVYKSDSWQYAAYDAATKTGLEIIRSDINNYGFAEEDSFDLDLMEESFASSDFINREKSRKQTNVGGYPSLDVTYQYKDSSLAFVRFVIDGPRYYTLIAVARADNKTVQSFLKSFTIKPFVYGTAKTEVDTALHFTVQSVVPLQKKKKLDMYPEADGYNTGDADDSLADNGTYADKIITSDSTGEKIYVTFYTPSAYLYQPKKEVINDSVEWKKDWIIRYQKRDTLPDKTRVMNYELGGKGSSRMIKGKLITAGASSYKIETETDTLSKPGAFINSFFQTFKPASLGKEIDVKTKKTVLFFTQFFSADSVQHKAAIKNVGQVTMDSTDFPMLKKSIGALSWKEKKYPDVKKEFIGKLSSIPTKEASDYLRSIYFAAGDTVDLQYTSLETLLQQGTQYAYQTFAGIMQTDPPVLDIERSSTNTYSIYRELLRTKMVDENYSSVYKDGSFLDDLNDSLPLTAGIFKSLLPLLTINDYEQPLMELSGTLLDSSLITAADYEAYLPKLLIEAKQALKKQLIQEKAKAIDKAKEEGDDKKAYNNYDRGDRDDGNTKLSLYATLLLPFWDKAPAVQQMITQMLNSKDNRLKYNTALLLLRNKRPLPDTMLHYFAAMDEYRYELYGDLKKWNRLSLFPLLYKNQLALARSEMLSSDSYSKPDTIVLVEKVPLKYKQREGYVYVFKYKEKKDDNSWKLGTAGLLPKEESRFEFEDHLTAREELEYEFTDRAGSRLTSETSEKEQVEKLIKRLVYSKRKSAARFYNEGGKYDFDFSRMR